MRKVSPGRWKQFKADGYGRLPGQLTARPGLDNQSGFEPTLVGKLPSDWHYPTRRTHDAPRRPLTDSWIGVSRPEESRPARLASRRRPATDRTKPGKTAPAAPSVAPD